MYDKIRKIPDVVSATFYETGTYQKQYNRNFKARTMESDVVDRLLRATADGRMINQNTVSSIADDIMSYDSHADSRSQIYIPEGWNTPRLSFVIVIEYPERGDETVRQILTGYTDRVDISYGGVIAGDTRMFINNVQTVGMNERRTSRGRHKSWRNRANGYIMRPTYDTDAGDTLRDHTMRPEDIFNARSERDIMRNIERRRGGRDGRNMMVGDVKVAQRIHNSMSTYITDILRSGISAEQIINSDEHRRSGGSIESRTMLERFDDVSPYELAASTVSGSSDISTMGILADFTVNTDFASRGEIELDDFERLADWSHVKINVIRPGKLNDLNYSYDRVSSSDSEGFDSADEYGIAITTIMNAIPALMFGCNLVAADIVLTNDTLDGQARCAVTNAFGYSDDIDLHVASDLLEDRIVVEVYKTLSGNGRDIITVDGRFAIHTGMDCILEINQQGERKYTAATFADGLTTPMRATNIDDLNTMADDMDDLIKVVLENRDTDEKERIYSDGGSRSSGRSSRSSSDDDNDTYKW